MIPHLARLALAVVLVLPVTALGEIINLTNGRKMEGKIVKQDDKEVVIEVPAQKGIQKLPPPPPIKVTIQRSNIASIISEEDLPRFTIQGEQRGLRYLFGSLPDEWRERWNQIVSDSSPTGLIVLVVVSLLCIVMIPALMLHAGSTIVGVTDPTYSRALLCVFLLYAYTFLFLWLTNRIGWLVTLELVELGLLHFALLLPLYLAGQSLIYKWAYVTDWGKAIPLVFVGLLVGVITSAGGLILMNIFA